MGVPILGQNSDAFRDRDLTVKQLDTSGPQIRLLFCFNCKSIEELPDYEGPSDRDDLLMVSTERHVSSGVPHKGHLIKVPLKMWAVENLRREIVRQIKIGSGGISELDPDFYDTKSQFQEDALACYSLHLRPPGQCADWKSDRKQIVPKTNAARKDLGMPTVQQAGGPKTYLCQFCPVAVYNAQKAKEAAGVYK